MKFDARLEAFDDSELQDFLKDKELLSAREHFFIKQETPYLLVFLTYLPGADDLKPGGKQKKDAWRELISEEQLPLFNRLRDWRNERAKAEAVPPYVTCTNMQLALMAVKRPDSLAALGKIQGFGEARVKKYGSDLLALLKPENTETSAREQPELFDAETQKETG